MRDPITNEPIGPTPPASPDARPVYGPGKAPAPAHESENESAREEEERTLWGTVAIGRNIGSTTGRNLSAYDWENFQQEIADLFSPPDFTVEGISRSSEHGEEETFIAGGTFLALTERELRSRLAYIARWYFQDAISLTIGGGERIEALKLP